MGQTSYGTRSELENGMGLGRMFRGKVVETLKCQWFEERKCCEWFQEHLKTTILKMCFISYIKENKKKRNKSLWPSNIALRVGNTMNYQINKPWSSLASQWQSCKQILAYQLQWARHQLKGNVLPRMLTK